MVDVRSRRRRRGVVNRVRAIDHVMARFFEESQVLGKVHVRPSRQCPITARIRHGFAATRRSTAEIDPYRRHFARPVDHELVITLRPASYRFRFVRS